MIAISIIGNGIFLAVALLLLAAAINDGDALQIVAAGLFVWTGAMNLAATIFDRDDL